jgi:hypothetical protein
MQEEIFSAWDLLTVSDVLNKYSVGCRDTVYFGRKGSLAMAHVDFLTSKLFQFDFLPEKQVLRACNN